MPLLTFSQSKKVEVIVKLEDSTAKLVDRYANFGSTSADQVVNAALEHVFSKDRDFQQHLSAEPDLKVPATLRIKKPTTTATLATPNHAGNGHRNASAAEPSSLSPAVSPVR
jgi:hypothetical protein